METDIHSLRKAVLLPWSYERSESEPSLANSDEDNIAQTEGGNTNWVYRYPYRGTGVVAFVFDSGIRATHNEFDGAIIYSFNVFQPGQALTDEANHGTPVAGVLGGTTGGAANGVSLIPIDIGDEEGAYDSAFFDGVEEILDEHSDLWEGEPAVANISFAGDDIDVNMDDAVQALIDAGIVVTIAAGQPNPEADPPESPVDVETISPQRVEAAIVVGGTLTKFNWQGVFWEDWADPSNYGEDVDILTGFIQNNIAQNTGDTDLNARGGTSFSAPRVAGAVAILLDQNPTLSPAQIESKIKSTGRPRVYNTPSGTTNKALFINDWWYPFHTYEEWENSDLALSTDYWLNTSQMGWIWTSTIYYPWFYRHSDDEWIKFIDDTPWITFLIDSTSAIEAYWP